MSNKLIESQLLLGLSPDFSKTIKSINVFSNNKLIVTNDDSVYGFGENTYGELGLGHNNEVFEPTLIPELSQKQIIEFNNGLYHCIARSVDGKLYSFGANNNKQLGNKRENENNNKPELIKGLKDVMKVSCGESHTIVLRNNGEVFGWGLNGWGQIGIHTKEMVISIPTTIKGFNNEKIKAISCGYSHSMALTTNGSVFGWGRNKYGQLGVNSTVNSYVPQMIQILDKNVLFNRISCGQFHSLLLSTEGNIYSFGFNLFSQIGCETTLNQQLIPLMIETNPRIHFTDIFCHFNESFSSALSSTDDFCYIWGKCEEKVIKSPKKTVFKTLNECFIFYFKTTAKAYVFEKVFQISNNKYSTEFSESKQISNGTFGDIFEANNKKTFQKSAIKTIRISAEQIHNEKVMKEIKLLLQLKNEYIITYRQLWIESKEKQHFLYIEMELCLKTLNQLNHQLMEELNCKQSLNETPIGFYIMSELMKEVIEGLNYLHKNNIIHGNLKPQNILIIDYYYKINKKFVKISDFGLSRIRSDSCKSGSVETVKYTAPELRRGRIDCNHKIDVYSFAIIIEEMLNISELSVNSRMIEREKFEKFVDLKDRMINNEHALRPECEEVLEKLNELSLNFDELTQFSELSDCLREKGEKESINENFVQYFLRNRVKYVIKSLESVTTELAIIRDHFPDKTKCIDLKNFEQMLEMLKNI